MSDNNIFGGNIIRIKYHDKEKNEFPFEDGHIICIIVGSSGSGKSTLVCQLLPKIKCRAILICSLIIDNPVYDSIQEYCKINKIRYDFASNPSEATDAIENLSEEFPDEYKIVIYDDFSQATKNQNNAYAKVINMSSMMLRNLKWHTFLITQDYINVNTLTRNNCNHLVMFKLNNKFGVHSVVKDLENLTSVDSEVFKFLYRKYLRIPHSFLFCTEKHIYLHTSGDNKRLSKVIVENDSSDGDSYDSDVNDYNDNAKMYKKYIKNIIEESDLDRYIDKIKKNDKKTSYAEMIRYIKYLSNDNNININDLIKVIGSKYGIQI